MLQRVACTVTSRKVVAATLRAACACVLQFKLDVANTVVNQENMSLETMDTGKLLDLFGGQAAAGAQAAGGAAVKAGKATGLQAMLASMGEMWDEKEYEAEFSMQTFMNKLGKGQQQQ
jgi:TATA-binding protein-associated factor